MNALVAGYTPVTARAGPATTAACRGSQPVRQRPIRAPLPRGPHRLFELLARNAELLGPVPRSHCPPR
jgi:hypothetical protein